MGFNTYPYTDLHEMNLDWIIAKMKELIAEWTQTKGEWTATREAFLELKAYVENFFQNLDVQDEINNKLDEMVEDGTMEELLTTVIRELFNVYTPEMFGAAGDGVTDDTEAMREACLRGPVLLTKKYKLSDTITVNYPIISENAEIVVSGTQDIVIFDFKKELEEVTTTSEYFDVHKTTLSSLQGKAIVLTIDKEITTGQYYKVPCGVMYNGYYDLTLGFVTPTMKYVILPEVNVDFGNVTLNYLEYGAENDRYPTALSFNGCNVRLHDIVIKSNYNTLTPAENKANNRMIEVLNAYNVSIENVFGVSPVTSARSSYVLSIAYSGNVIMKNVNLTGKWHPIVTGRCGNMQWINVTTTTVDSHRVNTGKWILNNVNADRINVCSIFGELIAENCNFCGTIRGTLVSRNDNDGGLWGRIEFKNCKMYAGTDSVIYYNNNGTDMTPDSYWSAAPVIIDGCDIVTYRIRGLGMISTVKFMNLTLPEQSSNALEYADKNFYFINCRATTIRSGGNVNIIGCTITSQPRFYVVNEVLPNLVCMNNVMSYGFYSSSNTVKNAIVTGNRIRNDSTMTLTYTNGVVDNNIIDGSSKTHLSEWNVGAS